MEHLEKPNIDYPDEVQQVDWQPSWIDPFIEYLTNETLLADPLEAYRIK